MAFPPLIQKIFDLRHALADAKKENARLCAALAAVSENEIRMCDRITRLELAHASDASTPFAGESYSPPCANLGLAPEGQKLPCGAIIAPVTLVERSNEPHHGSAFTIILDDMNNKNKGEKDVF